MSFQDKQLTCADCGKEFTFGAADQEFFKSKGYVNEPKRCPTCRQSRKDERSNQSGNYSSQRQRFAAVCSQCGKETQLPFQPRENRPVYCSDCYNKVRQSR